MKETYQYFNKRPFLSILLIIFVIWFSYASLDFISKLFVKDKTSTEVKNNITSSNERHQQTEPVGVVLDYSVVSQEDYYPNSQKFWVVLSSGNNQADIKATAEKVVEAENKNYEEITLFIYDNLQDADGGNIYNIAIAEWNGSKINYTWDKYNKNNPWNE